MSFHLKSIITNAKLTTEIHSDLSTHLQYRKITDNNIVASW